MNKKYAVIGKGFIYPRHVQAIEATGGEVIMTCDINKKTKPDFTDWVEMFHDPKFKEVDTVVVLTPNYLHSVMCREAVSYGKEVLCEKPLCIEDFVTQNVNSVLQLRYHPEVQKLKTTNIKEAHVTAKMFRGKKYFDSWKGNNTKSGGILYNLGIHYLDLLTYLLGYEWSVVEVTKTDKLVKGIIKFENAVATFHIEIVNRKSKQGRNIIIDGQEITLSNQENLSYEDLHRKVYEDLLVGKCVKTVDCVPSLLLAREINEF